MSLYNMIHGVKLVAFTILPMLGKHPSEYPRFRDCFLEDEGHPEYNDYIQVYTRVGGNNRGEGYGEEKLYEHPNFVTSFDDSFDNTFATYVFSVPDEWKADFELVKQGKFKETSQKYRDLLYRVIPKLSDKWDKLFGPAEAHAAKE